MNPEWHQDNPGAPTGPPQPSAALTGVKYGCLGCGVVSALSVVGGVVALAVIGSSVPPAEAISGRQLEKQYVDQLRDLALLEDGEEILYFSSDGITSIEDGLYFFTEDRIVLYNQNLATPTITLTYEEVEDLSYYDGESWTEESLVTLQLDDGSHLTIPLSTVGDTDTVFYEALREAWMAKQPAEAAPQTGLLQGLQGEVVPDEAP